MLTVLDLFSGIGGFSLGLERTGGFKTVAFCEIDPFCRKVLAKHWPGVPCFEDITAADFSPVRADVICGGFPCQDISDAGKRAGIAGERSGLWRYMVEAIRVVQPRYAVVENVAAITDGDLGVVLGDLAEIGFSCEWHCIPAFAIGAHHRRDRWWAVAHSNGPRLEGHNERSGATITSETLPTDTWSSCFRDWDRRWLAEPDVGRVAHGIPSRVDRLRALGNAVVPQIPELIGRAILKAEGLSA